MHQTPPICLCFTELPLLPLTSLDPSPSAAYFKSMLIANYLNMSVLMAAVICLIIQRVSNETELYHFRSLLTAHFLVE